MEHYIEELADEWCKGAKSRVAHQIVGDRSSGYSTAVLLVLLLIERGRQNELPSLASELENAEMLA